MIRKGPLKFDVKFELNLMDDVIFYNLIKLME